MNAIEMKHVSKTYGSFAIKDLNLTLPEGCIMGLVGENGAGKSTFLKREKSFGRLQVLSRTV